MIYQTFAKKHKIIIMLLLIGIIYVPASPKVLAQSSQKTNLELDHTYSFSKGYPNTFMEAQGDSVGLICPNLRRVYIINSKTYDKSFITFKNGRGPGEISRGPFGMDFGNDKIYLADTDAQRLIECNFHKNKFLTELYQNSLPLYGIYGLKGETLLAEPTATQKVAYIIYQPSIQKSLEIFYYPHKKKNPYRYSGMPAISSKYLIHANRYFGDLIVWNKDTAELVKRSTVEDVSKPKSKKGKFGKFTGRIPPQNPELKIIDVAANELQVNSVFLLMNSKNGKYKTNYIYDYDFMREEVVSKFKLPANTTILASDKRNLFVYSKEKDALYQYKLESK